MGYIFAAEGACVTGLMSCGTGMLCTSLPVEMSISSK